MFVCFVRTLIFFFNVVHLAAPVIAASPAFATVKSYAAARKFHLTELEIVRLNY